ncbi:MAG: hypothetical protein J6Z32_01390 [Bacteroidales bacterium]|nr:hypothetical protein [Bacteroidales bacterium]MBP5228786.1 hypothetical protein [Bacteroidales bacterium]MBR4438880.1 hypothetical protein [Bacteroidales bacterium]MBR4980336.1 hypothetical protein [Bacteroidales bacterium]MBR5907434.1 hypothetical protein [Bacteroidales bacterium]
MATRNETEKTLDQLQKLIQELVMKYEVAKSESESYLAELTKVKTELHNTKNKLTEQEKKLEHYELKQAFLSTDEASGKRAKRRLGKIIKEIDKCIQLLND